VTLIARCACHRVGADTRTSLAGVCLSARIAIVARGAVGSCRIRAAGDRIAGTGGVALIEGCACHRITATTNSGEANFADRAGITVGARRAVGSCRIRAGAVGRIAGAGRMTLIARRACDRIGTDTRTCLAGVCLGTSVAVVASRAVGSRRIGAGSVDRIAGASGVTLIERRACHRITATTNSGEASFADRAGITVGARRAVWSYRIGADTVGWIAGPSGVTLIARRACHWVGADTDAILTNIGLSAGVSVVAGRAIISAVAHYDNSPRRWGRSEKRQPQ
jgi:hypothetical protein